MTALGNTCYLHDKSFWSLAVEYQLTAYCVILLCTFSTIIYPVKGTGHFARCNVKQKKNGPCCQSLFLYVSEKVRCQEP